MGLKEENYQNTVVGSFFFFNHTVVSTQGLIITIIY
jgi:hypothetical protein